MAKRAIAAGADRVGLTQVLWDISGRCEAPVSVELGGHIPPVATELREGLNRVEWLPGDKNPLYIGLMTACRKCRTCLRARASRWRGWISAEIRGAPRTWFGTLTVEPQRRSLVRLSALRSVGLADFADQADEFRALHQQIGKEITKFLKRVRKGNKDHPGPHRFRYCLVAEAHKDGFPHYHLMVHEVDPYEPIRKELLSSCWSWGFSSWKLIDNPQLTAAYVAKYLSKSSLARVRASEEYGRQSLNVLTTKPDDSRGVKITDPPETTRGTTS